MENANWDVEEIKKEIIRLDKITGLNGASVPIYFHERGSSLGLFSYRRDGKMHFSFSRKYFSNPDVPAEVRINTIRHEYAHYMDYLDRGTTSHSSLWKQCCLIVGAHPVQYYNPERADRINLQHKMEQQRSDRLDSFCPGMTVRHKQFGEGRIETISGENLSRVAKVVFKDKAKYLDLGWLADNCEVCADEKCG